MKRRQASACARLAGIAFLLCIACAAARADHSDAPGIDWFSGDVQAAFNAAAAAHRPVFLYWGAKWCPPCQQL